MVCFSSHRYQFLASQIPKWLVVLNHFYSGCPCTVNGTSSSVHSEMFVFTNTHPNQMITVEFRNIWDEGATFRALPVFHGFREPVNPLDLSPSARKAVQDLTDAAVMSWNPEHEMGFHIKLDVPAAEMSAMLRALPQDCIRTLFYSPFQRTALIGFTNGLFLIISNTRATTGHIGCLDLDDGFCSNGFGTSVILPEMQEQFQEWRQSFLQANETTEPEKLINMLCLLEL